MADRIVVDAEQMSQAVRNFGVNVEYLERALGNFGYSLEAMERILQHDREERQRMADELAVKLQVVSGPTQCPECRGRGSVHVTDDIRAFGGGCNGIGTLP